MASWHSRGDSTCIHPSGFDGFGALGRIGGAQRRLSAVTDSTTAIHVDRILIEHGGENPNNWQSVDPALLRAVAETLNVRAATNVDTLSAQVVVREDGRASRVTILNAQSIRGAIDRALGAARESHWEPATVDWGRTVPAVTVFPFTFRAEEPRDE